MKRRPLHVIRSEVRKKLKDELRVIKARLTEAEWLIRELDSHEGAEGWSEYLRKRLDKYEFFSGVE